MKWGQKNVGSPERFALEDYTDFALCWYWSGKAQEYDTQTLERINIAHTVLNEFVSVLSGKKLAGIDTDRPATHISVYYSRHRNPYRHRPIIERHSSTDWIYASDKDVVIDPLFSWGRKPVVLELKADAFKAHTAEGELKKDTKNLVSILLECMGMQERARDLGYELKRSPVTQRLGFNQNAYQAVFRQIYDELSKGELPPERYRHWGVKNPEGLYKPMQQQELF